MNLRNWLGFAICGWLIGAAPPAAAALLFNLNQFTGSTAAATITVSNAAPTLPDTTTNLLFTVQVTNPAFADIRAIWFNIANNALLSTLSAVGNNVTSAGSSCASGDTNMNPRGFEFCVEIGTPGIGAGDDNYSASFTLSSSTTALNADNFFDMSATDGAVGLRITSVGISSDSRGGSSKLANTSVTILSNTGGGPVPEPATIAAFGVGLIGLAWAVRRVRAPTAAAQR